MGGDQTQKLAELLKSVAVVGADGVVDLGATQQKKREILEIFDRNDPDRFEVIGSMTAGPIKCVAVCQHQADTKERGIIEYRYYYNDVIYAQLPAHAMKLLNTFRESIEAQQEGLAKQNEISYLEAAWDQVQLDTYEYASSEHEEVPTVEFIESTTYKHLDNLMKAAEQDNRTISDTRLHTIFLIIRNAYKESDEDLLPMYDSLDRFCTGITNVFGNYQVPTTAESSWDAITNILTSYHGGAITTSTFTKIVNVFIAEMVRCLNSTMIKEDRIDVVRQTVLNVEPSQVLEVGRSLTAHNVCAYLLRERDDLAFGMEES